MADFVASLVDMGFDKEKSQKAVDVTGNRGVEAAMEWLLANSGASGGTGSSGGSSSAPAQQTESEGTSSSSATPADTAGPPAADAAPKSYKCEDCGKLFTSMETVEFHAAKTNHANFSESTEEKKPLTTEEKAAQASKLHELMKVKRAEREAREKKEEIEKEKLRMQSGKELAEARRRIEEQEMKEIAEQRRREKIDDQLARQRVKAQIEADKIARKLKFGGGGAEAGAGGSAPSPLVTPPASSKPSESDVPPPKKDYKETKLQLRLPGGKTIVQTFGVNEPLASVRLYVELNRDDGATGPFNFMTTFPKRLFQGDDYDAPLDALGLVPSAVLMVTKSV